MSSSWQQICATLFRKLWETYKKKFLHHKLLHIYISDQIFGMKQNLKNEWKKDKLEDSMDNILWTPLNGLELGHLHTEIF